MASNFSANQYERAFSAKNLCNWEVPKWPHPHKTVRRTRETKFIANERGHLLPHVERPKTSPWGGFKTTWQLPDIITREMANELSKPQVGGSRWALPEPKRTIEAEVKEELEKLDFQSFSPEDEEETLPTISPTAVIEPSTKPKLRIKEFSEKEKLNNPIAISRQGRRAIRHETLERDNDLQ
jgi:hypothetical protein